MKWSDRPPPVFIAHCCIVFNYKGTHAPTFELFCSQHLWGNLLAWCDDTSSSQDIWRILTYLCEGLSKWFAQRDYLMCIPCFWNLPNISMIGTCQSWASLNSKMQQVLVPFTWLKEKLKLHLSPGKDWRWLCPLQWDHKVSLWLSPFLSQHWLSCHHPQTQSPGLAYLAPDCPAPAAMVDSTAVGFEPKNKMRKSNVAVLSSNGVNKHKL